MHLRCSNTECAATLDLHDRALSCPVCAELLEVVVDPPASSPAELKRTWLERRCSYDPRDLSGVWRFREFLPNGYSEIVTMGEGNCPLIEGRKTAQWAGLRNLRFKHLGWNPTACFKDLGMTVGVTEAVHVGAKVVGCASTGNTSGSLAAYAARAGLYARVYLPAGQVSTNKLAQAVDFGAEIVHVAGNFDVALQRLLNQARNGLYFLNSINPFRLEGQKTAMFEMLEQLGWQSPDYVVVPGGNLGNSSAFGKALEELHAAGFLDKLPRLVIVQAEGANPLAKMWCSGSNELHPVDEPGDCGNRDSHWQSALMEEGAACGAKHERLCHGCERRRDRRSEGDDRARRHRLRTRLGHHVGRATKADRARQDRSRRGRGRDSYRPRSQRHGFHP